MAQLVRRALVSTFDKHGIAPFCRALIDSGFEILSTGGTATTLLESGVPVVRVSDYTGAPEILGGRVKTLHPKIHAGILAARSEPSHLADLENAGAAPIDLVVVNLYPFRQTVSRHGVTHEEAIEMIDIGGPTMVRAAAKNHAHVAVVVDPTDYDAVLDELRRDGSWSPATRLRLAVKAFRHTAEYDAEVQAWLGHRAADGETRSAANGFPDTLSLEFRKTLDLVYGENPHQRAAFYLDPLASGPSVGRATQIQGKPLSFNNVLDFDGALSLALRFAGTAAVIVKHGNPCGVATAARPADAFRSARDCDPLSAFGGVIALNRRVDADAAEAVAEAFYEGIVAPAFEPAALAVLSRKKNLRVLEIGDADGMAAAGHDLRRVRGGLLVQDWDDEPDAVRDSRVVTRRSPTENEWRALEFAWTVVRHVKSNAIVFAFEDRTVGIGAGQMSRVDSVRFAVQKSRSPLAGAAVASDAFFPFRDGLDVAAAAGIRAAVQPGGSIRDAEVIEAADGHGMAMVFTGRRHFRH